MKAIIFFLSILYFLSGCSLVGIQSEEQPSFTVLQEEDKFQVRQYGKLLVAKTVVKGDYKETNNKAFWKLANYIFGENEKKEEISMTAPVIRKPNSKDILVTEPFFREKKKEKWTMYFVLPSEYTLDTVPKPSDPSVKIQEIPAKTVATIKYTGLLKETNIKEKSAELLDWIKKQGYTPVSLPRSASYNPPWTFPYLRKNEIHIDIQTNKF